MKTIIFASLLVYVSLSGVAQETPYGHSFSGEIFGLSAEGVSAQYDYLFKHSARGFFDVRAGVGGILYQDNLGFTIPHAITYNFGKKNRFLEVGAGATYRVREYKSNPAFRNYYYGPIIGYRSIAPNGFQFRAYVNFFWDSGSLRTFPLPFIGVGFGKAYRKK